jgi:hypothetical protein
MLTESYGCIAALRGVKCLDAEGAVATSRQRHETRPPDRSPPQGAPIDKRIVQKREIAFDLFGPVWGAGDAQRLALATALVKSLPEAKTSIELEEINALAEYTLGISRTAAADEWVRGTVDSMGWPMHLPTTAARLKRSVRIFLDPRNALDCSPCGWPAVPQP